MGKAHSEDLRRRVLDHIASGHSCRAAERVFGVSASTAIRLVAQHRASGTLGSKRQGRAPGTAGKRAPHRPFVLEIVAAEPDITLAELACALAYGMRLFVGLDVSLA